MPHGGIHTANRHCQSDLGGPGILRSGRSRRCRRGGGTGCCARAGRSGRSTSDAGVYAQAASSATSTQPPFACASKHRSIAFRNACREIASVSCPDAKPRYVLLVRLWRAVATHVDCAQAGAAPAHARTKARVRTRIAEVPVPRLMGQRSDLAATLACGTKPRLCIDPDPPAPAAMSLTRPSRPAHTGSRARCGRGRSRPSRAA